VFKYVSDKAADKDSSAQYLNPAGRTEKLITGNLLGVGKKVEETNPKAKESRRIGRQVRGVVRTLKQNKGKEAAEEALHASVEAKLYANYHEHHQLRSRSIANDAAMRTPFP
jgi:hypothetical protein